MDLIDKLEVIVEAILVVLGLVGVICPKLVTKKEERENPDSLKKARLMGVVEVVLGIVLIVMTVV
ncbi:MAG: hypothetical protein J6J16_04350 [Lachnospiraceae bacterium]|nr:hypothetical protein [Lachnospiraceae bacterium]